MWRLQNEKIYFRRARESLMISKSTKTPKGNTPFLLKVNVNFNNTIFKNEYNIVECK